MRKIYKIFTRLKRFFIFKIDGINTKIYMNLYNKWLLNENLDLKGPAKYIHSSVKIDGIDYRRIHVGKNVVISRNTILLIHDFSVEAGFLCIDKSIAKRNGSEAYIIDDIMIGNDCFIGANVTILPGTRIGDNCIIGAGSVLPGKIYPSNSVIVGNPARIVAQTDEWAYKKYTEGKFSIGYIK